MDAPRRSRAWRKKESRLAGGLVETAPANTDEVLSSVKRFPALLRILIILGSAAGFWALIWVGVSAALRN
ncbi:hypothetical protein DJ018_13110 [Phenylobacterium deserti]|uniref:Uncharacterized protein n=1 Tax=Phenylobacterium deserti TaxID=1914756 RepID=A0A328AGW2_9CAUL|nr:hypothetical protein DJ018_13110 [Phenylobacterium deserti]